MHPEKLGHPRFVSSAPREVTLQKNCHWLSKRKLKTREEDPGIAELARSMSTAVLVWSGLFADRRQPVFQVLGPLHRVSSTKLYGCAVVAVGWGPLVTTCSDE